MSATETTATPVPTWEDRASGRLNGHTLHCKGHARTMHYAACLARLQALDDKTKGTSADWQECAQHRRAGQCEGAVMRDKELAAGKVLFFAPRLKIIEGGVRPGPLQVIGTGHTTPDKKRSPARAPAAAPGSVLDALKQTDYAAAINAQMKPLGPGPATPPAPQPLGPGAVSPPPPVPLVALPGESPLQMIRRISAQQAAQPKP